MGKLCYKWEEKVEICLFFFCLTLESTLTCLSILLLNANVCTKRNILIKASMYMLMPTMYIVVS